MRISFWLYRTKKIFKNIVFSLEQRVFQINSINDIFSMVEVKRIKSTPKNKKNCTSLFYLLLSINVILFCGDYL